MLRPAKSVARPLHFSRAPRRADLHVYVDSMHDLSILVADPQTKQYAPKGKDFIKGQLLARLKQAAK
jgi:hypothetical protein